MKFPTLSACDLFEHQNKNQKLVVHELEELFLHDIYIPKKPHRHTFYQIIYIQKGKGVHTIDFVDYRFDNQTLFFISPGQVHDISFIEHGSIGLIINFSEDLFHTFLAQADFIDQFPFFKRNGELSAINITKPERFQNLFLNIRKETRIDILRLYTLHILYESNALIAHSYKEEKQNTSFQKIRTLEDLIEEYYETEHSPSFYAEQLSITENYLNAICKKERQKTAGQMIRERIALEAKRLLVNSKLNISEIAFLLGFEDNSYFTKFFKSQENLTPRAFRKTL